MNGGLIVRGMVSCEIARAAWRNRPCTRELEELTGVTLVDRPWRRRDFQRQLWLGVWASLALTLREPWWRFLAACNRAGYLATREGQVMSIADVPRDRPSRDWERERRAKYQLHGSPAHRPTTPDELYGRDRSVEIFVERA